MFRVMGILLIWMNCGDVPVDESSTKIIATLGRGAAALDTAKWRKR
jgi:hypothetical protein